MIVYLEIPLNELAQARSLGAKFDVDKRMWFVKDHPSMDEKTEQPDQHPFVLLFGKWFASKMKKIRYEKIKYRNHIVTQPRTPRKKSKKNR